MMNLREIAFFYNHIAVMLHAGVGIIPFFETIVKSEKNDSQKVKIKFIIENLKKGETLTSTLHKSHLIPVFDLPVIEAGEKSGELVKIFKSLSKEYDLAAATESVIRGGLLYPFLLLGFALLLPSAPAILLGEISPYRYFITIGLKLGFVIFVAKYVFHLFMKSYYSLSMAKRRHALFAKVPFLRNLSYTMSIEKFCSSLELMLEAGIPIFDALKLAGQTSPNDDINMACRRIVGEAKGGKPLPLAFEMESIFPHDIVNSITLGHESGEIPAMLRKSAEMLRNDINRDIGILAKMIPVIIHAIVMIFVAYNILSLYLGNLAALGAMF
ncbi:type II secretion system F family protein [bacterium]|nr:type II secretion system F family protein [bacterium]